MAKASKKRLHQPRKPTQRPRPKWKAVLQAREHQEILRYLYGYFKVAHAARSIRSIKATWGSVPIPKGFTETNVVRMFWVREKGSYLSLCVGSPLAGPTELCRFIDVPDDLVGTGHLSMTEMPVKGHPENKVKLVSLYLYSKRPGDLMNLVRKGGTSHHIATLLLMSYERTELNAFLDRRYGPGKMLHPLLPIKAFQPAPGYSRSLIIYRQTTVATKAAAKTPPAQEPFPWQSAFGEDERQRILSQIYGYREVSETLRKPEDISAKYELVDIQKGLPGSDISLFWVRPEGQTYLSLCLRDDNWEVRPLELARIVNVDNEITGFGYVGWACVVDSKGRKARLLLSLFTHSPHVDSFTRFFQEGGSTEYAGTLVFTEHESQKFETFLLNRAYLDLEFRSFAPTQLLAPLIEHLPSQSLARVYLHRHQMQRQEVTWE